MSACWAVGGLLRSNVVPPSQVERTRDSLSFKQCLPFEDWPFDGTTTTSLLCAPPVHPASPLPRSPTPPVGHCLPRSAFSGMSYSWHQTACSLFRLAPLLSNTHLRFLHVFSRSGSLYLFFFLNIPMSGCPPGVFIYHLVKDIWAVSRFGQLRIMWLQAPVCVDITFQLIWVNTKERNCWIIR